jgi:hypothetical protein
MSVLRCNQCGDVHWVDVSCPSEIWNQIAAPSEMLCGPCIDQRLRAKGLTCEAKFYMGGDGKGLSSAPYLTQQGGKGTAAVLHEGWACVTEGFGDNSPDKIHVECFHDDADDQGGRVTAAAAAIDSDYHARSARVRIVEER